MGKKLGKVDHLPTSPEKMSSPVNLTGYQLLETKDSRQVNYNPSGDPTNSSNTSDQFVIDAGIPIKSPVNNTGPRLDKKPLINKLDNDVNDSTKGSILSTGRHLLDGSALSHRSIINLYAGYKQNSDRPVLHRLSFVSVIIASILWVSCWCGVIFLPLAMIVLGVLYRDSCPSIPHLPGLLIVMGIVTTINNIVNVIDHIRHLYIVQTDQSTYNPNRSSHLSTFSFFLNFVTLILIVYLAVILFKHPSPSLVNYDTVEQSTDILDDNFCSPIIYNFASSIIYLISLLCIFISFAILFGCCYILWKPARCSS